MTGGMGRKRRFRSFERAGEALIAQHAAGRFDLFSFDVFDTLVYRRCAPETVLHAVAVAIAARLGGAPGRSVDEILRARDAAYQQLADQSVAAGRDPDTVLPALCTAWAQRLIGNGRDAEITELAEFIERTETEYEVWSCVANPVLLELCMRLQAAGARLIYVSDMYLGRDVVARILEECGLQGLFAAGYVSGDVGLLKRTGRLFDHMLDCEGVPPSRICHLGDDELADGTRPAEKGMAAWFVRDVAAWQQRSSSRFDYRRLTSERPWYGVAAHSFATADRSPVDALPFQYGRQLLGLPIAVFLHRVAEYCERHGVQRVFFLSREGFILREVYDQLRQTLGLAAPPGDYLCVSRLSSGLAAMTQYGLREVNAAVAANAEVTPRRVLAPLRLPEEALQRAAGEAGVKDLDQACEVLRSPALARLLQHSLVAEAAADKGHAGREALIAYLRRQGFFDAARVAVVDVGWGAQIQENIELAVAGESDAPEVHGLYLGIDALAVERRRAGCRIEGALVDPERYEWSGGAALDFVHLFEILTRAPHGTVLGYRDGEPIFAETGTPERKNEEADDAAIAAAQRGLLHYARHYARAMKMLGGRSSDADRFARTLLCRMIRFPRAAEVDFLIGLKNISHLGSAETLTLGHRQSAASPLKFMRAVNGSLWSEGAAAHGLGFVGTGLLAILKAARTARRLPPQASAAVPSDGDLRAPPAAAADGPREHDFEEAVRTRMQMLAGQGMRHGRGVLTLADVGVSDLTTMYLTWRAARLYLRLRGLPPVPADMLSLRSWWSRHLYHRRTALSVPLVSAYRGVRGAVRAIRGRRSGG